MKMTEEVTNNRNNLIYAIALVEDISRTNNGIYESLKGLINNPGEIITLKRSINSLYEKVTKLKNSDLRTPLIEEEEVVIPKLEDISPEPEPVVEEAEAEELVVEEPPRKKQNTRGNRRGNARGRQPRKPLRNKKELPSPDIDSI